MVDKNLYSGIPDAYSTPSMVPPKDEEKNISLINEMNPNKNLHEMMQQMQGKIWDSVQKKYIDIEGAKPLMNREGMDTFFHFATSVISSLVTMSNYTKDYKTIHALLKYYLKKANFHFHLHYKDYGISRKTKISIIVSKLFILGMSAFYKAIGAGDRKAATSNISESISTLSRQGYQLEHQSQNKKSMLRRILGR